MTYSADDVIYLIAIRSAGPKNGDEVKAALESIRGHVEPVTEPKVVARQANEYGSPDHDALVRLGFTWDHANTIFPVAVETKETERNG